MGAGGLTALVITVHTPALAIASLVGFVVALVVAVVLRRRPRAVVAWASLAWWLAVGSFSYAVFCALVGVRAFDVEAIGIVP